MKLIFMEKRWLVLYNQSSVNFNSFEWKCEKLNVIHIALVVGIKVLQQNLLLEWRLMKKLFKRLNFLLVAVQFELERNLWLLFITQ